MNSHNVNVFFARSRRQEVLSVERTEYPRRVARTLTSQSLFQGDHEIGIDHGGSLYRLKITRQGKLILNK